MAVRWLLAMTGALVMPAAAAVAQTYPSRQVTMIVPFAAGGPVDNGGRVFAEAMRRQLGSAVLVDNRAGAGGVVGTKMVIAAKPDGYTLLIGSPGPLIVAASAGAGIDPDTQLAPVGLISESPQIMVASKTVKADTLAEFVAFAKASPGTLNYSSAGIGTMPHLAGELFKSITGIDMLHVPYRGTGETISDLIAGRIDFYMNSPPPLTPLVREGRLRALCVSSDQRHPGLPDIPSAAEQGFSGMPLNVWFSVFAPRGVPAATVALLSEKLGLVLADERLRARAFNAGALVAPSSPEQLADRVARETAFWRDTARVAGITAG